jgi:hypothetical protein
MKSGRPAFYIGGAFVSALVAGSLGGCISKSRADADSRAAYIAGENSAFNRTVSLQRTGVIVIGPVENPEVSWTNGLTLAQAILAAHYTGISGPMEISLTRQGETARLDPKDLLRGRDVPLEPGDTITLRP